MKGSSAFHILCRRELLVCEPIPLAPLGIGELFFSPAAAASLLSVVLLLPSDQKRD